MRARSGRTGLQRHVVQRFGPGDALVELRPTSITCSKHPDLPDRAKLMFSPADAELRQTLNRPNSKSPTLEAAFAAQGDGSGVLSGVLLGHSLDMRNDGPGHLVHVPALAEPYDLRTRTLWHGRMMPERSGEARKWARLCNLKLSHYHFPRLSLLP
ncbi:MAG TPA: hypothetical protein VLI07_03630 [Candidatus Binatus sp.]|nr:hypothetical protein [Candidatus Binatus sp.]